MRLFHLALSYDLSVDFFAGVIVLGDGNDDLVTDMEILVVLIGRAMDFG